jgi:NAD(P)-dependent dehydrogenase (short-subunit alcohol dehydrogenase family)
MLNSKFSLKGKVALITGAAGIQGPNEAKALKEAGAEVIISDVDQKRLTGCADKLKLTAKLMDVSSENSIKNVCFFLEKKYHRLDILVNNAAATGLRVKNAAVGFEEQRLEDWNHILSINLTGTFLCCKIFSPLLLKSKNPSIINIGSIYGIVGPDFSLYQGNLYKGKKMGVPAAYAASKAAIVGLTKYLATYWAEKDIRVNCITMGGVFDNQNENFVKKYSHRVPLGKMAAPDDIAGALLYLAASASSYVTGQNVIVDGGLTAW